MALIGALNFTPPSSSLSSILEPEPDGDQCFASTKLIATLGPESRSLDTLVELLRAGMAVARFDFSYGTVDYHLETLQTLRQAVQQTRKLCGVMLDTRGPEITVINRTENSAPVQLSVGDEVIVTSNPLVPFNNKTIPLSIASLTDCHIDVGTNIFIGQHLFTGSETTSAYLTVKQVTTQGVVCMCNSDCILSGSTLTAHITGRHNTGPIITQQDLADLRAWVRAAPASIDFLSLSFCRNAHDVAECRTTLASLGHAETAVLAKVEDKEGVAAYRELVDAADGVIFSRGNLGIDLPSEKIFLAQKLVIGACNLAGKPCIVTRVVDTMVEAPRPTRAEATDVANLVLDGADGILLGSETFRGKNPVATARIVLRIARQAERVFNTDDHYAEIMAQVGGNLAWTPMGKREALASTSVRAASKVRSPLIVVFTTNGMMPRMVSKWKPPMPILAIVMPKLITDGHKWQFTGEVQARQCLLYRGVIPLLADPDVAANAGSPDFPMLRYAVAHAAELGLVKSGDNIVVSQCRRAGDAGELCTVAVDDVLSANAAKQDASLNNPLVVHTAGSMPESEFLTKL